MQEKINWSLIIRVFYGYSTIIDVNLKRTPMADNTNSAMGGYTYEMIGSNEAGTALLEKLLSAMPTGEGDIIDQISLLYQPLIQHLQMPKDI